MFAEGSLNSFRTDYDFMMNGSIGTNGTQGLEELLDFLKEVDLQDYFEKLSIKLKVRFPAHLKYVDETDLLDIGMTRPEMRRLHKFLEKQYPQTAMGKIKKKLSRNVSNRSVSVPRSPLGPIRAQSYSVRPTTGTMNPTLNSPTSYIQASDQHNGTGHSKRYLSKNSVANLSIASSNSSHNVHSINGDNNNNNQSNLSIDMIGGERHLISESHLQMDEILKEGDFAVINKGRLRNTKLNTDIIVAVKTIPKSNIRSEDQDGFIKHMFTSCFFDHSNIARFFGVSLDADNVKLVTEYCELGSLEDALQKDRSPKLSFPVPVMHNIAVQLAKALAFLEGHQYVHGNVQLSNVLLYPGKQIKLTDAGLFYANYTESQTNSTLTRSFNQSEQNSNQLYYLLPPELRANQNNPMPTLLSDVWSFGILVWRLFNYGSTPLPINYDELNDNNNNNNEDSENDHVIDLEMPALCPKMIFDLLKSCWSNDPIGRPTFLQLSTQIVRIHPERLVALFDGPDSAPQDDCTRDSLRMLEYLKDDIIIVLDRSGTNRTFPIDRENPTQQKNKEYWKGCLLDGSWGYFKWSKMRAEMAASKANGVDRRGRGSIKKTNTLNLRTQSLSRGMVGDAFAKLRLSKKLNESNQYSNDKRNSKFSAAMISAPGKDFRHVGHVGCNGDVFGDVTSLYTSEAQQNIKSGMGKLSFDSKGKNSMDIKSTKSDSTIRSNGEETPPYATIDANNEIHMLHKNPVDLFGPPHLPERNSTNTIFENLLDDEDFSLFDDLSKQWDLEYSKLDFSKFSKTTSQPSTEPKSNPTATATATQIPTTLPKVSEINITDEKTQYDIDLDPVKPTRTNPIKPPQSLPIQPIISESSASVVVKNETPSPPKPINENNWTIPSNEKSSVSSSAIPSNKKPISTNNTTTTTKSGFLNKFMHKSTNQSTNLPESIQQSNTTKKSCDSPVYAKIHKEKPDKKAKAEKKLLEKEKKAQEKKKNSISGPVLMISSPTLVVKGNDAQNVSETRKPDNIADLPPETDADDIFIDCTSEVSSLQPSPKDSLIGLNNSPPHELLASHNQTSMTTRTNSFGRQDSYNGSSNIGCMTNHSSRHKLSNCDSSTVTTISPASSFASFGSMSNCNLANQGGLRMLKKTDGVFRASGGIGTLNRRRPSIGANTEGTNESVSGYTKNHRQPSLPNSTVDRLLLRQQMISNNGVMPARFGNANNSLNIEDDDIDDEELDATTPVANPTNSYHASTHSKLANVLPSATSNNYNIKYNIRNSHQDTPESFNHPSRYSDSNHSQTSSNTFNINKDKNEISSHKIQFNNDDDEVAL